MKIIVIGATGVIGRGIIEALGTEHDLVRVSRKAGDVRADMADVDSLRRMFEQIGSFDALICAAGDVAFGPMEDANFGFGVSSKLLGQAQLVRLGLPHIRDRGSFTLTSGILSQEPIVGSTTISMINAGVEGFVRAAALELPRGVRVNVVSPPWVCETLVALGKDPSAGIPMSRVSLAYLAALEENINGQVLDAREF